MIVPENMAIPRSMLSPRMELITPPEVYWYNRGGFDHLADMAVAVLGEESSDALDAAVTGFTAPRVGEDLIVYGYPKSGSEVIYAPGAADRRRVSHPTAEAMEQLFVWGPVEMRGRCTTPPSNHALGQLRFDGSYRGDVDGLSGSPILVDRKGRPTIAGMIVRGNSELGHFISGKDLLMTVARAVAKNVGTVDLLLRVVADSVSHLRAEASSLGGKTFAEIVRFVMGVHGDDKNKVRQTLTAWLAGKGSLGRLALQNSDKRHLDELLGEELSAVVRVAPSTREVFPR